MGCLSSSVRSALGPSATADGTDNVSMENPLSTSQIIKKDHRCFWLLVFLVLWWITMAILWWVQYSKPSSDPNEWLLTPIFGVMSAAITTAILLYVAVRSRRVATTLNAGIEVKGRVTYVGPNSEDVWFVEFEFQHNGQTFKGTQTLSEESSAKRFVKDQEIALLVDQQNPARSFIKEVYILSEKR